MLPHLGVLKVGDKVLARGLRYLFKIVYSLLQRKRKKKKKRLSATIFVSVGLHFNEVQS